MENSTSVMLQKWLKSLLRGGHLQEFLTVGLLLEKFWYFKKGVPT